MLPDPRDAGGVAGRAAADARGVGPELAHQEEDEDRREQEHRDRSQRAATDVLPHESRDDCRSPPWETRATLRLTSLLEEPLLQVEEGALDGVVLERAADLFESKTNTVGSWYSGIDTASSARAFWPCFTLATRLRGVELGVGGGPRHVDRRRSRAACSSGPRSRSASTGCSASRTPRTAPGRACRPARTGRRRTGPSGPCRRTAGPHSRS